MLQDRLEDLPQPVVVGSCWLGPLMQLMQNIKSDTAGWGGAMSPNAAQQQQQQQLLESTG